MQVSVTTAKGQLTDLVRRAEAGDDIILTRHGQAAVRLIVASRRNLGDEMAQLVTGLGFTVESVSHAAARRVADAYGRWGKRVHAAGLNFGDCFAYEIALNLACPLLFVGDNFRQTDVVSALAR